MNYTIREMASEDYSAAIKIWTATPGMKIEEADSEAGIARYLSRNPGLSHVAEIDGEIIGTVLCGEDGRRGYLQHLCVKESHRNKGIAKALLKAAIDSFRTHELYEIRIFVFKDNELANEFWQDQGWFLRDDIFVHAYKLEKAPAG